MYERPPSPASESRTFRTLRPDEPLLMERRVSYVPPRVPDYLNLTTPPTDETKVPEAVRTSAFVIKEGMVYISLNNLPPHLREALLRDAFQDPATKFVPNVLEKLEAIIAKELREGYRVLETAENLPPTSH